MGNFSKAKYPVLDLHIRSQPIKVPGKEIGFHILVYTMCHNDVQTS